MAVLLVGMAVTGVMRQAVRAVLSCLGRRPSSPVARSGAASRVVGLEGGVLNGRPLVARGSGWIAWWLWSAFSGVWAVVCVVRVRSVNR